MNRRTAPGMLVCATLAIALVAAAVAGTPPLVAVDSAQARTTAPAPARSDRRVARTVASPSAAEFGEAFVASANAYARAHGEATRFSDPDCVQAAPGRYMCSYTVRGPDPRRGCHLMQARWTPHLQSTITVTLAGKTRRCGSLREALDSLD